MLKESIDVDRFDAEISMVILLWIEIELVGSVIEEEWTSVQFLIT